MYEGYVSFAGNEVVNHARLQAYVAAGYSPAGVDVKICDECGGLPEFMGDKPYASPLIDQAPWFESGNPDTWDFAGVQMLEMTGANGSTRTATVGDLVGDGSTVRGVRYAGRTIACTALLIGKTGCSVEAGLSWLSQTLAGSNCTGPRPNTADTCSGDELCLLACCPAEGAEGSPVPNVRTTDEVSTLRWQPTGGFYDATTGHFTPTTLQAGSWTNLVRNPSFESGIARWFATGGTLAQATNDWGMRWGNVSALLTANGGTQLNATTENMPISKAWQNVRVSIGTISMQVQARAVIRYYDAANNQVGPLIQGAWLPLNTVSYGTLWGTGQRPAAATKMALTVEVQTPQGGLPAAGTAIYLDAAIVRDDTTSTKPVYFDGNGVDGPGVDFAWTGTPNDSTSTLTVTPQPSTLTGPVLECYDNAIFDFGLETISGSVTVTPQAVDADGSVLWTGQQVTVRGNTPAVRIVPDATWGDWRPRLLIEQGNPFTIDPVLDHPRFRTPEECADQLLRSYHDCTTVDGPHVVEKIAFNCGEYFYKVEWTIVAANPAILGATEDLVSALWADTAAGLAPLTTDFWLAPGVSAGVVDNPVVNDLTDCDTGTVDPLSVFDLCCPGFALPPSLPYIQDTCLDLPTTYNRTWIQIPKDYAPTIEDGLLSITITNDKYNKRGLRIRIYPDPIGNGYQQGVYNDDGTLTPTREECDFCDEFFITYIPGNAVWRLDGSNKRITTQPSGIGQQIISSASVRGRGGGPFGFPVMQCNMGYLVVVDVPTAYVENCGADCIGFTQGSCWVDITLRRSSL